MTDTLPPEPLTAEQRRALRAQAHHLHPVVAIAGNGASPAVLREIGRALDAHGLIKVRLYGIEREAREAIAGEVVGALKCHVVQHIGNLLVLWRQRDEDSETSAAAKRRSASGKRRLTKKQAAEGRSAVRVVAKPRGAARARSK